MVQVELDPLFTGDVHEMLPLPLMTDAVTVQLVGFA
jgi:hypothetical protein